MALCLVGCGNDGDVSAGAPAGFKGVVRKPAIEVGSVALTHAVTGEPVEMRAQDGEILIAYFGYTGCPDVCPTTMSDIRVALGELPAEAAEKVTVALITLDPERDTGEILDDYLGHFFDRYIPVRVEDPAALQEATDAFGVQFEVADHQEGEPYEVAHTAISYVIDDSGTVVVEWPFGFDSPQMVEDIETALDSPAKSSARAD